MSENANLHTYIYLYVYRLLLGCELESPRGIASMIRLGVIKFFFKTTQIKEINIILYVFTLFFN